MFQERMITFLLGFSVYLNEDWSQDKEKYINLMADIGFEGIFTSLHIPEDDVSLYKKRLKPLLEMVKARKLKLMADISGDAMKEIGLSLNEPKAIFECGFTGLRIDDGVDMETVANLSHYLTVGLNASTLTENDYEQLVQNQADFRNMEASHNYYPRPGTGLDEKWFYEKNRWLKSKRFRIGAFAPGDSHLRFPLYKTLPTLECHRYQNPFAVYLSLIHDYNVDDVYIGDPGISDQSYKQFREYLQYDALLVYANAKNEKWNSYIYKDHKNRLDVSRDVIRSERSRSDHKQDIIRPENTVLRSKGSITVDNFQYDRYKGELQIMKKELSPDEKVNVIGQVIDNDLPILDFIQGGMTFTIADTKEAT